MQKFFLTTFAALLCVTSQAEPLFYKMKMTVTRTGAGVITKFPLNGYAVVDSETLEFGFVLGQLPQKQYFFNFPEALEIGTVVGSRNTSSFIQIKGEETFTGLRAKGVNSVPDLTGGTPNPRTMVISGSDMFSFSEGGSYHIDEYKGTLVYDKVKSESAHNLGTDFSTALEQAEAALLALGYTPF